MKRYELTKEQWERVQPLLPPKRTGSSRAIVKSRYISESVVLADFAYSALAVREHILNQRASYVIPPKSNSINPWPIDRHLYKERHLIECFFQKFEWFRRIAARYDKLDTSFLAFVHLAAIVILSL